MIRRAIYYFICATGYILLTAKGCEPETPPGPTEKETQEALIRKWEATFDTAFLGEERQVALMQQGTRKLIDFFDYVHLIGDTRLDQAFRKQATATATHLSKTIRLSLTCLFRVIQRVYKKAFGCFSRRSSKTVIPQSTIT